jgi:ATP-dependent DNA ligase
MREYSTFKYIYPPRPATKAPATGLSTYERMGFIAQPKLNGYCAVLFTDGESVKIMGRHNNVFSRELIDRDHLRRLHKGSGWMVLVGEYMNKSQRDGQKKLFDGVFVIFDILVHNGQHLVKSTFIERQRLLDKLYGDGEDHDDFTTFISPSVYRAKNFTADFDKLWKKATTVQMYEGFVLKRPSGILENGLREANNTGWMVKIRKPTKNYSY